MALVSGTPSPHAQTLLAIMFMHTLSRLVAFVVILSVGMVACGGCNRSNAAARRALSNLQKQTDLHGLQEWAYSIVSSSNPQEAFSKDGKRIPTKLLKPGAKVPEVELFQFGTGEWMIKVDGGFGLENYGIALGRTNALFPPGYKVYTLKPGVYYFHASL